MKHNLLRKIFPTVFFLVLASVAACGGAGSSNNPLQIDANLGVLSPTEQIIFSKYYAGELVVYLDDEMKAQVTNSKSLTVVEDGQKLQAQQLQDVVNRFPHAKLKSLLNNPSSLSAKSLASKHEASSRHFKAITGVAQKDFRNVLKVEIRDSSDAVKLLREVKTLSFVDLAYPNTKDPPSGAMDSVPELTGFQQYLSPLRDDQGNFLGGLSVNAAREQYQVQSAPDLWVVDEEAGMYSEHPDLDLNYLNFSRGGNVLSSYFDCDPSALQMMTPGPERDDAIRDCPKKIEHGTAVLGVLGALEDNGGVEGIVPENSTILLMPSGTQKQTLGEVTDGENSNSGSDWFARNIIPGSVWLIETHTPGFLSHVAVEEGQETDECDVSLAPEAALENPDDPYVSNPCYGFLPTEADRMVFDGIQQAIAFGVTVIEGAGNGGVDLDDESAYKEEQQHVLQEDSGAIIVAASLGADFRKHPVSNCGSRVNLFAWGQNVVTTGWVHPGSDMDWLELPGLGEDPSDPDAGAYYVNNFRGTSSATAIIGGVAGLVQSFAKQELGTRSRYLMPTKIKEILVASGVPQEGGDCNIGVQPQADEALRLVREFVQEAKAQYPELANNQVMSAERIQSLRNLGVGLICGDYQVQAPTVDQPEIMLYPDPSCNEEVIHPTGTKIAKDLDFDGDSRAELIKWTRDGGWKVDLSSRGGGEFGFGAWDLTAQNPAGLGEWVSPYAIDLDSDGRTDFVLYDRENNVWSVMYTRWNILQGTQGVWQEIQYDANEWADSREINWRESKYSRPVPGDYNGDGWVDIAIACSDGVWRIDYSEAGEFDGDFDDEGESILFLDDAQLAAAPGWAYLPFVDLDQPAYRVPDTVDGAGDIYRYDLDQNIVREISLFQISGNDYVLLNGEYDGDGNRDIAFKSSDTSWSAQSVLSDPSNNQLYLTNLNFGLNNIFGGPECHPVAADFDGDSLTDRAVLCPDGWTIAYSQNVAEANAEPQYISRRYTGASMGYDENEFTVPGRVYFGGISYEKSLELIRLAQRINSHEAPPIPVDMVTPYFGE